MKAKHRRMGTLGSGAVGTHNEALLSLIFGLAPCQGSLLTTPCGDACFREEVVMV